MMARRAFDFMLCVVTAVGLCWAKQFNTSGAWSVLNWARAHHDEYENCNTYATDILNGATGSLIDIKPGSSGACTHRFETDPGRPHFRPRPEISEAFISDVMVKVWAYRRKKVDPYNYTGEDKQWVYSNLRRFDVVLFYLPGRVHHIGIVLGWSLGGLVRYTGKSPFIFNGDVMAHAVACGADSVVFLARPEDDQLGGCRAVKEYVTCDSTFGAMFCDDPGWGAVRHKEVCCWKEHLGGHWPWSANPSAYACLSWEHNALHTWDTLISPRIDLRGCTGTKLHQMSVSTLDQGTRRVLGSTNDGATWPYVIGDDQLQEADIPWADGKQQVRLAWGLDTDAGGVISSGGVAVLGRQQAG